MPLPIRDLTNGVPGFANAVRELGNTFSGRCEVIKECHAAYVPRQGTLGKYNMCPSGVLGSAAYAGHNSLMLPNNIAAYRTRAGLTQSDLAEAIGTTRNMMVKLEGGSRGLTSDWLEKLSGKLGVPAYLLIAPEHVLPTESQLAEMLNDAQQTLPAGLPYSEWPKAVASGLHMRLRTLAGDLANAASSDG